MKITSAKFVKGIVGTDDVLEYDNPQIAFVGRSNVGKSSTINALTNNTSLARVSKTPGSTQEINLYVLNNRVYLLDLPGYGFAKTVKAGRERYQKVIDWYLFKSEYEPKKVVLIVDAEVGLTKLDEEMLTALEHAGKNITVLANKVDKIKSSQYEDTLQNLQDMVGDHAIIPFSATKKIGIGELVEEILV